MADSKKVFDDINASLNKYATISKRLPGRIIKDKAIQLVLGSKDSKYGIPFKGAYELLRERMPQKGKISEDTLKLFKSGKGIKISEPSKLKANAILNKGESGLFRITKKGGIQAVFIKGKKHYTKSTKNAPKDGMQAIIGLNAAKARRSEKMLNRSGLAAAFEIRKREGSRGYLATAYLYRLFRDFKRHLSGNVFSAKLVNKNRKGMNISNALAIANENGAVLRIVNNTSGARIPAQRRVIERVLGSIKKDIEIYLKRKKQND